MRLEYHILWFDDQPNNVQHMIDNVKTKVSRHGFDPKVTMPTVDGSVDPLLNLPNEAEVDLVLMDWKLGNGLNGAELARRVRTSYAYTDIVFYSAADPLELRKQIYEQNIDRVFCVGRTGLVDGTIGIIRTQLRRVLDLNHMRGVVMAATSDLDNTMIECLGIIQKIRYAGPSNQFAAIVSKRIVHELCKKVDQVNKYGKNGRVDKLLKEPSFHTALRHEVLKGELREITEKIREVHLIDKLEKYSEEVITPRNDLAHRRVSTENGIQRLEGRAYHLDEQYLTNLRLNVLAHTKNFRALLTILGDLAGAAGETQVAEDLSRMAEAVADMETKADAQE